MKLNNKQRILEIIEKIDKTNFVNETKAFAQLRKLNKELYDKTIKLEGKIGEDILKSIEESIKKENLKYKNDEELELIYLIILDLILSRFLDKKSKK